jgi:hypothetical protein
MADMRIMKFSVWIGIALIFVTGVIHITMFPAEYKEAPYLGLMFLGAFLGSIIAAIGIYRKQPLWGWGVGALIALGSLVGYVLSRTVGLPVSGVEPWGPALGYLSLVVEILFFLLFIRTPEFNQLILKMKQIRIR